MGVPGNGAVSWHRYGPMTCRPCHVTTTREAHIAVTSLEIERQTPFEDGASFGDVGPYELLEGTAHFAVDPLSDVNTPITDIELAPRDADGMVRFSSDFVLLRPANPEKGNGALLLDVVNRGNKTILKNFNSADPNLQPFEPIQSGNGFLMRHGYTLVWCGWQPDLPSTPGLVGMRTAPEALGPDGRSLQGNILGWYQVDLPTDTLRLSHSDHRTHPPVDPEEPTAALYASDHPNDAPTVIDRGSWTFVEGGPSDADEWLLHMPSGFQPGRIYQLVYRSTGSVIVGLGMAAVRDIASFLKHAGPDGNPVAGAIDHAYAFGRSQCGRFLRQYVHAGLNEDEAGRMALDGIIAHVAGAMRGEFNLRFGQPSKDICFICPELFPFTDTPQLDPLIAETGSMLTRLEERGSVPKIMFINTSSEYWRGDAALIHTNLEDMSDAPEHESVRRYHLAGTQHGSGEFPPLERRAGDGVRGQLPFNTVDYNPLLRAALDSLHLWVTTGKPAPPSEHPSLDAGTAVETSALAPRFLALPGVRPPARPTQAMRLDNGPESHLGRTTTLPPDLGQKYPALVSDVDSGYNEVAGIRLPDLQAPVATHTGWNLRHPESGNPGLIMGVSGGLSGWTLPFPATRTERESTGDPRPSIEERYASRDEYLQQVQDAARRLVDQRFVLEEDVPEIMEKATTRYDYFTTG
jgi:hypothetical protein